jgi:ABC-2 type transport system ATP-binding protein
MDFAIDTYGLKKKYRRVNAVDGLDLEVPQGAIYALVGPNGAGKTTAIKVLMNILQPTSGSAKLLGQDSTHIAGKSFCSIGYVSENQQLPGWMRVDSLLAYLRPFYPTWDRDLENDLVKKFELPLDRKLKHLSRGMRMKAALASTLAYRPKLIVLDEPLGGLDPLVRDELIEGLLERAAESTIFISSHDLAEIETFASHAGYMEQGRLRFSEEMSSLAGRFREVELAFDSPSGLPPRYPETWMQVETTGAVLKFIASRFDEQRTTAEIHECFAGVRDMTFVPMSLRAIFLAMAKSRRAAGTTVSAR